jgi:uncharacterized protein with NRDE domain
MSIAAPTVASLCNANRSSSSREFLMCLIVFAYECHPYYRLILGANRDEYRDRPADQAGFWSGAPHLLAGRDRQAGGTWMGVTTTGKLAAITNYRDPRQQIAGAPSRGKLVSGYLQDENLTPQEFRGILNRTGQTYDGFNLIYGTINELHYFTNRGGSSGPVTPGIHGLSNHLLDTRWAKVTAAKSRLEAIENKGTVDPEEVFEALSDPAPFADSVLPDTGVGPERERMLSPIFIDNALYGTRSTTVLLIDRYDNATFIERVFDHSARTSSTRVFNFRITPPIT